jgi:Domain of unknown function (DUF4160)
MPRISTFYGIVIAIYYDDHVPPHFHALYSGDEAVIRIDNLEVLAGGLPRRDERSSGSGPQRAGRSYWPCGSGPDAMSLWVRLIHWNELKGMREQATSSGSLRGSARRPAGTPCLH